MQESKQKVQKLSPMWKMENLQDVFSSKKWTSPYDFLVMCLKIAAWMANDADLDQNFLDLCLHCNTKGIYNSYCRNIDYS